MNYLIVLFADLLQALDFVVQKKYQAIKGSDMRSALKFNAIGGLSTALIFFAISGFKLEFSVFSFICATGMALCFISYSIFGFKILREGGTAIYTVFLMSGGMLMPYIFGVLVLNERLTFFRIAGIIIILFAVFLSSQTKVKFSTKLISLCVAVFILNGFSSIISKIHQINIAFSPVSSVSFVMYSTLLKSFLSATVLFCGNKSKSVKTSKKPLFFADKTFFMVLLSATFFGISYMLQLVGAKTLPASVLYPLITSGIIVFSALSGKLFLGEKISKTQVLSIALCFIGTLLFL